MTDDNTNDENYVDTRVARPPFPKNNLAALKIGDRSPRVYGRVAEGIAEELAESMPELGEYPEELAALATTEAVVMLLRLNIAKDGIANKDGTLRLAVIDRYFAAERAAAKRRDAMGLSPLSEAVLARERAATTALAAGAAVDLEGLARRGRAAREAREDVAVKALNEVATEYQHEWEQAGELHAQTTTTEKEI